MLYLPAQYNQINQNLAYLISLAMCPKNIPFLNWPITFTLLLELVGMYFQLILRSEKGKQTSNKIEHEK